MSFGGGTSEPMLVQPQTQRHVVVIVGAGMAGLYCARELQTLATTNDAFDIVILEAANVIGGRCRCASDWAGGDYDVGAEFVHGTGTLLSKLIEEFRRDEGVWGDTHDDSFWEEIFITSHADGGPDAKPTAAKGMYGMYHVDGKLLMYNDPSLAELNTALQEILDQTDDETTSCSSPAMSMAAALLARQHNLPSSLRRLAVASYGNTAAAPLPDLSLAMIRRFETYWDQHEIPGDWRVRIGMHGVAQGLANAVKKSSPLVEIRLNNKVRTIREIPQQMGRVQIIADNGTELHADVVVVTVPPPLYKELDIDLLPSKVEALSFVGFERIVKVCILFSCRLWPARLQSVVCADSLIPEFWFRETDDEARHIIAVGYLASTAADHFADLVTDADTGNQSNQKAGDLFVNQLAEVLHIPVQDLHDCVLDVLMFDWKNHPSVQGGYAYPRVGMTTAHLEALAAPMGPIMFAGEATNTNAFGTVQAAMETGARAAKEAMNCLRSKYSAEKGNG
jgi:monoamine oxidase